jgi:outer membrane protein TolC
MKMHLTIALLLGYLPTLAQPPLTLEQCYTAARAHYPQLSQKAILQQTGDLAVASLTKIRQLPQLAINGQATWQSEVTNIPIELPNISIPRISQDQYRLTLDASYPIYDGHLTRLQIDLQRANTATARQQVEVDVRRLDEQVNGFFLNALLTDETIRLTRILLTDLQNRIDKLQASVKFGTVAQTNVDALQVEYLRSQQRIADLTATRQGLRDALHLLTDLPIDDSTRLVVETPPDVSSLSLNRPELQLYTLQRQVYDTQFRLADNKVKPRLSLFGQGGVGRPGLNLLNNNFRGFFIGGLRLNWNLSAAYTLKNDRQAIALNQQLVDVQRQTFERNLTVQLRQQQTEIDRIRAQLSTDADIVVLRSKIRQAATVQLDNGAIAARDYTTELNNENQALLSQKLHELQLLLAQIQYRTLTGN